MKTIPLTQGKMALVDDADYEWLNQWKWFAYHHRGQRWYARHHFGRKLLGMHRLILNAPEGIQTDHADGDGLNNQRHNIRVCTTTENARNQSRQERVIFKGVGFSKARNKWVARITVNKKRLHLGHFSSAIEAAREYDLAANHYFGEFARTNFPVDQHISWKLKTPASCRKTSRFRGVAWDKQRQFWEVKIHIRGKNLFLGRFQSEVTAAQAYNSAALKYLGTSAKLNVIEEA